MWRRWSNMRGPGNDKKNFCKPVSYCSWNSDTKSCGCAAGSFTARMIPVCAWGTQPPDCLIGGCFGFSFQVQPQFDQGNKPGPPMWSKFPGDDIWKVALTGVKEGTSGPECYYGACRNKSIKVVGLPSRSAPGPNFNEITNLIPDLSACFGQSSLGLEACYRITGLLCSATLVVGLSTASTRLRPKATEACFDTPPRHSLGDSGIPMSDIGIPLRSVRLCRDNRR